MATLQPQLLSDSQATRPFEIAGPKGWKRRLEDPFNTYYRYPVALAMTRVLVHTPVTPNQISLLQPVFAAGAGWAVTHSDWRYHVLAVALFEIRSILDCVDGSLARAKKMSSPNGHAIDAAADWLGVVFLYIGIFHFLYHHTPAGVSTLMAMGVTSLALLQGAVRSMASDHYKNKYIGIFERKRDDTPVTLRDKLLAIRRGGAPLFTYVDVFILWNSHLMFEGERFNVDRSKPLSEKSIEHMSKNESSLRTKLIGFVWSISSGDAFLSFVVLSILIGQVWHAQVFFATLGTLWIAGFVFYNVLFLNSQRRVDADAERAIAEA